MSWRDNLVLVVHLEPADSSRAPSPGRVQDELAHHAVHRTYADGVEHVYVMTVPAASTEVGVPHAERDGRALIDYLARFGSVDAEGWRYPGDCDAPAHTFHRETAIGTVHEYGPPETEPDRLFTYDIKPEELAYT